MDVADRARADGAVGVGLRVDLEVVRPVPRADVADGAEVDGVADHFRPVLAEPAVVRVDEPAAQGGQGDIALRDHHGDLHVADGLRHEHAVGAGERRRRRRCEHVVRRGADGGVERVEDAQRAAVGVDPDLEEVVRQADAAATGVAADAVVAGVERDVARDHVGVGRVGTQHAGAELGVEDHGGRPQRHVAVRRLDLADTQVARRLRVDDGAVRQEVDPADVILGRDRRARVEVVERRVHVREGGERDRGRSRVVEDVNVVAGAQVAERVGAVEVRPVVAEGAQDVLVRIGDDDRVGPEVILVRERRVRARRSRRRIEEPDREHAVEGIDVGAEHAVVDREVDVPAGVDWPERRRERAGRGLTQDRGDVEDEIERDVRMQGDRALMRPGVVGVLAPDELDRDRRTRGREQPRGAGVGVDHEDVRPHDLARVIGPGQDVAALVLERRRPDRVVDRPVEHDVVRVRTGHVARKLVRDRDQRRRERVLDVEFERRAGRARVERDVVRRAVGARDRVHVDVELDRGVGGDLDPVGLERPVGVVLDRDRAPRLLDLHQRVIAPDDALRVGRAVLRPRIVDVEAPRAAAGVDQVVDRDPVADRDRVTERERARERERIRVERAHGRVDECRDRP